MSIALVVRQEGESHPDQPNMGSADDLVLGSSMRWEGVSSYYLLISKTDRGIVDATPDSR